MMGAMKITLLLLAAVMLFSADAGAEEIASAKIRRADHPFFNSPMNAPLRTGLAATRLSGGSSLDSVAWQNLVRDLAGTPLAVVDLDDGGDAEATQRSVEKVGARYARIPAPECCRPAPEEVDRFVAFVRELPDDAWVHIYGAGGEARTTTFMTMTDMMRNAKEVPFKDFLQRQYANGGTNLRDAGPAHRFQSRDARQRRGFLKLFHEYARKNADDFATPWSMWVGIKASNKGRR